jgi:hypothetical protein
MAKEAQTRQISNKHVKASTQTHRVMTMKQSMNKADKQQVGKRKQARQ